MRHQNNLSCHLASARRCVAAATDPERAKSEQERMRIQSVIIAMAFGFASFADAWRASRQQVLKHAGVCLGFGLTTTLPARAELGPDGFPIMKEDKPEKKQMTAAEAQCKYGQVGTEQWKEACREVKKETGKSSYDPSKAGKSLGGAYAM